MLGIVCGERKLCKLPRTFNLFKKASKHKMFDLAKRSVRVIKNRFHLSPFSMYFLHGVSIGSEEGVPLRVQGDMGGFAFKGETSCERRYGAACSRRQLYLYKIYNMN